VVVDEGICFNGLGWGLSSCGKVGKPMAKPNVKRHVTIVYNQIYAPLRDEIFHSIDELKVAFRKQLNELYDKK